MSNSEDYSVSFSHMVQSLHGAWCLENPRIRRVFHKSNTSIRL
ncbi:MAG: hypothetical protein WBF90_23300 [Rivularia sp. (in: cyanobacteria)]